MLNSQWFAVRTSSGREKSVAAHLQARGIEEFLPFYRDRRQWSDRTKEFEVPLFPGYLFGRFEYHNRGPVLLIPGVQMIVGVGKQPAPISDLEIDNLRRVVASGAVAHPHDRYLTVGERVRIREGSLAGVEGILVEVKNSWRIVLSVELLQRSCSVEVDRFAIEPASKSAWVPRLSPASVTAPAASRKAAN
jgi:transcription termination/antitermination protein NusG